MRHIRRLALGAAGGLVDHDLAVGQGQALALFARHQQERAHGRRQAHAHRAHGAADVVHGVIDRHARGHGAAGAVDVQVDIRVGIVRFQEQQLRHDGIGHLIVNGAAQEHHPVLEQPGIDIIGALAVRGLFDNIRDQRHKFGILLEIGYKRTRQTAGFSGPTVCVTFMLPS